MAEKVDILEIDASIQKKTISELKDAIKSLKSDLADLKIGTEEYNKTAKALNATQDALKISTQATKAASVEFSDSINGMRIRLQQAQVELRNMSTTDPQFKQKAKEAAELSNQLNKASMEIGSYKDNIGRYAEGFTSAFSAMGGSANALTSGIGTVGKAFSALAANPLMAVIAAFVIVVMKLVDAFKKNEDAMDKLKVAFAPFQGIVNALSTAVGKLVGWLADKLVGAFAKVAEYAQKFFSKLAEWAEALGMDDLAASLGKVNMRMEESTKIAQSDVELQQESRRVKRENAEIEARIVALRKQYNEAVGDTKKQAQLAKQIEAENLKIKQNNVDLAQREYDLIVAKNKQTPNSEADNDAEVEALARLTQAQGALNDMTAEQRRVLRQAATDRKTAAKERQAEIKEEEKQYERLLKQLTDWQAKQSEADQMPKSEAALKARFDKELAMLKDNEEAKKTLRNKYEKDLHDLREKMYKQEITDLGNLYAATRNATKQHYLDIEKEIAAAFAATNDARARAIALEALDLQQIQDEINQKDLYLAQLEAEAVAMEQNGVSTIEIQKQITQTRLEMSQLELQQIEMQIDAERRLKDERIAGLTEGLDVMSEYMSTMSSIGDGISSKWAGVFSSLSNGIKQVSEVVNSGAKGFQKYGAMAVAACSVAANTFSALADQQDQTTKEGFEKQKKYQIAAATMSMLGGVVSAWTSAMSPQNAYLTIWGQIAVGALMSALMLATGGMQIANIQKQQMNGSTSASSASATPSAPALAAIQAPVQYSSDIQGTSVEQEVQSQRVYVTENDISTTQNRVAVAENESTF